MRQLAAQEGENTRATGTAAGEPPRRLRAASCSTDHTPAACSQEARRGARSLAEQAAGRRQKRPQKSFANAGRPAPLIAKRTATSKWRGERAPLPPRVTAAPPYLPSVLLAERPKNAAFKTILETKPSSGGVRLWHFNRGAVRPGHSRVSRNRENGTAFSNKHWQVHSDLQQ